MFVEKICLDEKNRVAGLGAGGGGPQTGPPAPRRAGPALGCAEVVVYYWGGGGCLLGQGLEDGVHLFGHGHQHQLELRLRAHHAAPLVADVLQGGGDVDLLGALGHSVQHHVHQAVGARATGAVAAVHHDRT